MYRPDEAVIQLRVISKCNCHDSLPILLTFSLLARASSQSAASFVGDECSIFELKRVRPIPYIFLCYELQQILLHAIWMYSIVHMSNIPAPRTSLYSILMFDNISIIDNTYNHLHQLIYPIYYVTLQSSLHFYLAPLLSSGPNKLPVCDLGSRELRTPVRRLFWPGHYTDPLSPLILYNIEQERRSLALCLQLVFEGVGHGRRALPMANWLEPPSNAQHL